MDPSKAAGNPFSGYPPTGPWSMPFGWPFQFNPNGPNMMPPQFTVTAAAPTPKRGRAATTKNKPWDDCYNSCKDDDNEDEPEEKERSVYGGKQQHAVAEVKRKRGRPSTKLQKAASSAGDEMSPQPRKVAYSSAQQLQLKKVKMLPSKLNGVDRMALHESKECSKCRFNVGRLALQPCGHAAFCFECVENIRESSVEKTRLQICPVGECIESVTGWIQMYNVSS